MDEKHIASKKALGYIGMLLVWGRTSFNGLWVASFFTDLFNYAGQNKSLLTVIIDVFYDTILPT